MRICLFEDAGAVNLQPLASTRPVFDLRCGAVSLMQRQLRAVPAASDRAVWVRPELVDLCRSTHPQWTVNDPAWFQRSGRADVVLINARWLPAGPVSLVEGNSAIGCIGERAAYVTLRGDDAVRVSPQHLDESLAEWLRTLPRHSVGGSLIDFPWDLVERNGAALEEDYQVWLRKGGWLALPEGAALAGPRERCLVDPEARIEPLTFFDTTKGPILIDRGAVVEAFSRIEGPCHIGAETRVLAARVRGGSIGPQCRIGGEVESSIVHGHSNKAHDGFLGHSYLGEWVNFGAGTQTSDLRNDYNEVSVLLGGAKVKTGLRKVGAFVGDHTKTSVNALFNTGTVVGPFGQLVTSETLCPRVLPPFSEFNHGHVRERTDWKQLFDTAATMMARRGRSWTELDAEFYFWLYEQTAAERRQAIRESEQRRLRRAV